jgi:thiamine transporter ThiT
MDLFRDKPFKFLTHQLSMVVYWTTMAFTGNGGLGFDSGEGA